MVYVQTTLNERNNDDPRWKVELVQVITMWIKKLSWIMVQPAPIPTLVEEGRIEIEDNHQRDIICALYI